MCCVKCDKSIPDSVFLGRRKTKETSWHLFWVSMTLIIRVVFAKISGPIPASEVEGQSKIGGDNRDDLAYAGERWTSKRWLSVKAERPLLSRDHCHVTMLDPTHSWPLPSGLTPYCLGWSTAWADPPSGLTSPLRANPHTHTRGGGLLHDNNDDADVTPQGRLDLFALGPKTQSLAASGALRVHVLVWCSGHSEHCVIRTAFVLCTWKMAHI